MVRADSSDTIAAPITAPGAAAVSTLRISGRGVREALERLLPRAEKLFSAPRTLCYQAVFDTLSESDGAVLDYALSAYFPGPDSFTGEDCAEISLHGSPYLLGRMLECLQSIGIRLAHPGEFSERAFHNGKLDLSQAEAVADLVNAESEAQAKVAREQLEGRLSTAVNELGEPLRNLLAEIEAYIDFPEEDIEPLAVEAWLKEIDSASAQAKRYISSFEQGRLCREGAQVVLVGLPNAGKSSLLNALVGDERAIVTPIPGTTRDSIEDRLSIGGLSVRLWDTAGIVSAESSRTPDEVEKLGIERSKKHLEQADLVLVLLDPEGSGAEQKQLIEHALSKGKKMIPVLNKADLLSEEEAGELLRSYTEEAKLEGVLISATTHSGLKQLRTRIQKALLGESTQAASLLVCNRRHLEALTEANAGLERARDCVKQQQPAELCAFELRAALASLRDIVGLTSTEDVLGRIFSKFCIGK